MGNVFVYQPQSGDRVFSEHAGPGTMVITFGDGCRVVAGDHVELQYESSTQGAWWRTDGKRAVSEILAGLGEGVGYDAQGTLCVVVPRNIAVQVDSWIRGLCPLAGDQRPVLWRAGLLAVEGRRREEGWPIELVYGHPKGVFGGVVTWAPMLDANRRYVEEVRWASVASNGTILSSGRWHGRTKGRVCALDAIRGGAQAIEVVAAMDRGDAIVALAKALDLSVRHEGGLPAYSWWPRAAEESSVEVLRERFAEGLTLLQEGAKYERDRQEHERRYDSFVEALNSRVFFDSMVNRLEFFEDGRVVECVGGPHQGQSIDLQNPWGLDEETVAMLRKVAAERGAAAA